MQFTLISNKKRGGNIVIINIILQQEINHQICDVSSASFTSFPGIYNIIFGAIQAGQESS